MSSSAYLDGNNVPQPHVAVAPLSFRRIVTDRLASNGKLPLKLTGARHAQGVVKAMLRQYNAEEMLLDDGDNELRYNVAVFDSGGRRHDAVLRGKRRSGAKRMWELTRVQDWMDAYDVKEGTVVDVKWDVDGRVTLEVVQQLGNVLRSPHVGPTGAALRQGDRSAASGQQPGAMGSSSGAGSPQARASAAAAAASGGGAGVSSTGGTAVGGAVGAGAAPASPSGRHNIISTTLSQRMIDKGIVSLSSLMARRAFQPLIRERPAQRNVEADVCDDRGVVHSCMLQVYPRTRDKDMGPSISWRVSGLRELLKAAGVKGGDALELEVLPHQGSVWKLSARTQRAHCRSQAEEGLRQAAQRTDEGWAGPHGCSPGRPAAGDGGGGSGGDDDEGSASEQPSDGRDGGDSGSGGEGDGDSDGDGGDEGLGYDTDVVVPGSKRLRKEGLRMEVAAGGSEGFDPLYGKVLTKSDLKNLAPTTHMCFGDGVFAALRERGNEAPLTLRCEQLEFKAFLVWRDQRTRLNGVSALLQAMNAQQGDVIFFTPEPHSGSTFLVSLWRSAAGAAGGLQQLPVAAGTAAAATESPSSGPAGPPDDGRDQPTAVEDRRVRFGESDDNIDESDDDDDDDDDSFDMMPLTERRELSIARRVAQRWQCGVTISGDSDGKDRGYDAVGDDATLTARGSGWRQSRQGSAPRGGREGASPPLLPTAAAAAYCSSTRRRHGAAAAGGPAAARPLSASPTTVTAGAQEGVSVKEEPSDGGGGPGACVGAEEAAGSGADGGPAAGGRQGWKRQDAARAGPAAANSRRPVTWRREALEEGGPVGAAAGVSTERAQTAVTAGTSSGQAAATVAASAPSGSPRGVRSQQQQEALSEQGEHGEEEVAAPGGGLARLPASSVQHLHGYVPPEVPRPPCRPGELRFCGLVFHPELREAVLRLQRAWSDALGCPLSRADPVIRQLHIIGVDPPDAAGAGAATPTEAPWVATFQQHGLSRNIVRNRLARLIGLAGDTGSADRELPAECPGWLAGLKPCVDPARGGAGLCLEAAETIKKNAVLGLVGGYVLPKEGRVELLSFEACTADARAQLHRRAVGPGGEAEAWTAWQFLTSSFAMPYVWPEDARRDSDAAGAAPAALLSMLGYGNLAALINDPRVEPRAWVGGHDVDLEEAGAKANCMVLPISVRGLALPVVVALRDIAPGEQLLRDYGPSWWRDLATAWEVTDTHGLTAEQLLWGPGSGARAFAAFISTAPTTAGPAGATAGRPEASSAAVTGPHDSACPSAAAAVTGPYGTAGPSAAAAVTGPYDAAGPSVTAAVAAVPLAASSDSHSRLGRWEAVSGGAERQASDAEARAERRRAEAGGRGRDEREGEAERERQRESARRRDMTREGDRERDRERQAREHDRERSRDWERERERAERLLPRREAFERGGPPGRERDRSPARDVRYEPEKPEGPLPGSWRGFPDRGGAGGPRSPPYWGSGKGPWDHPEAGVRGRPPGPIGRGYGTAEGRGRRTQGAGAPPPVRHPVDGHRPMGPPPAVAVPDCSPKSEKPLFSWRDLQPLSPPAAGPSGPVAAAAPAGASAAGGQRQPRLISWRDFLLSHQRIEPPAPSDPAYIH